MRLLRTNALNEGSSLAFEEFEGANIPRYAILSHTWHDEEILFAHIMDGTAVCRKGYLKVTQALEQARDDGIRYLWVDTCCIDKNSSAELSEAINSMYRWYEGAAICYAYIADVSKDSSIGGKRSDFGRSRWFTRGWCLQELLAPPDLIFFSKEWTNLGHRCEFLKTLTRITGIDVDVLSKDRDLHTVSIATRMSWASCRVTTRTEDMAYCLMGIFSVNMPLLYGEGPRSFQRLQEEIMKRSSDHSLFAWKKEASFERDEWHGLLADSPADFALSRDIVSYTDWEDREPYTMTNRGLQINIPLIRSNSDNYTAVLNCSVPSIGYNGFVGVTLRKLRGSSQQFIRVNCAYLQAVLTRGGNTTTIFVQQEISTGSVIYHGRKHFLGLWLDPESLNNCHLIDPWISPVWKVAIKPSRMVDALKLSDSIWKLDSPTNRSESLICAIYLNRKAHDESNDAFVIVLGMMADFEIGACAYQSTSRQVELHDIDPSTLWLKPTLILGKTRIAVKEQYVCLSARRYVHKGALVHHVSISIEDDRR